MMNLDIALFYNKLRGNQALKNLFLLLILFLFSYYSNAQETCPQPLDQTALEVQELIKDAPTKFKSLESFLQALPDNMKSNFIFMGESRSFQTASKDNPRVILMSPNSDIRLSFNTDPGQRGYNNIEISRWDPEKKEFIYEELTFDSEGQKPPKKHGDLACTTCHGDPPKPNWDTYNYWAGVIPFNKDTIVEGSVEKDWYLDLIKKTEEEPNPANRLSYLKPIEDRAQIEKELKENGYITRQFRDSDGDPQFGNAGGIATELFDRLQERQRCSESNQLSKDPKFDQFKYLLAGIDQFCSVEEFVPEWFHVVANDYFYGTLDDFEHEKQTDDLYSKNIGKLRNDTEKRQLRIRKDKDSRQRYFIEKETGSKEISDKEFDLQINKIGLNAIGIAPGQFQENIGEDNYTVSNYRYFLEPFGAGVSRFSTSIDPTTYSFADLFGAGYLSGEARKQIEKEFAAQGKEMNCETLKAASLEKLNEEEVMGDLFKTSSMACKDKKEIENSLVALQEDVSGQFSSLVDIQARNIFAGKCASCHKANSYNNLDYSIGGAPIIPFDDLDKLKEYLSSPRSKLIGMTDIIKDRVNRPHNIPGVMPLTDISNLSTDEKKYLTVWLEEFKSQSAGE
jgi:hypothetical protein